MAKLLIVEDDKELNKVVCDYLKSCNYEVASAFDGKEALILAENKKFAMVITDVMMPGLNGFELAKEIRKFDKEIPILLMTARDDKPSKQLGYKLGIDDYVTKPFDIDELEMKIKAILRRAGINTDKILEVGNLRLDKDEHTAYLNGDELLLSIREFDLLYKFLSYPKKTFTRSQLMDEFWDYDTSATSRTVDVYMAKLRDKTRDCDGFEIQTVHGLGYKAVIYEKK